MKEGRGRPQSWREYQKELQTERRRKTPRTKISWLNLGCGGVLVLILFMVGYAGSRISADLWDKGRDPDEKTGPVQEKPERVTPESLRLILDSSGVVNPPLTSTYQVTHDGSCLTVETSLDETLQAFVQNTLDTSLTVRAAMVVLEPATGQILSMAQFNGAESGVTGHLCLKAKYPAASLFKIVAAAAAMETCGFTPESTVTFRGRKYTLYRSQLKREVGKSDARLTLREAFSASINPVFGKLGIHDLGKERMAEYAERFLFNTPIPFDLPLDVSRIEVPSDEFGLAEIASGFNKKTMISPLHAALLASAVANRGVIMKPWLVKEVRDDQGHVLYRPEHTTLKSPIGAETARKMRLLMEETVITGTCRKAFKPLQRKESFKRIELGAKTGTINDSLDQYRVDWVTAYAVPEGEEGAIALSVLAVHGERAGIRGKDMARCVIDHYFSSQGEKSPANGREVGKQRGPDA